MPDDRSPKIAFVTGASAGIGAAVARELARRGYTLVLTARRADRLEQLARAAPLSVEVLRRSRPTLTTRRPPSGSCPGRSRSFGGLDVLVNNAGFGLPTLFAEADPADLRRQLEVNFSRRR